MAVMPGVFRTFSNIGAWLWRHRSVSPNSGASAGHYANEQLLSASDYVLSDASPANGGHGVRASATILRALIKTGLDKEYLSRGAVDADQPLFNAH